MKKSVIFFANNLNIGGMEISLLNLLNCLTKKYDITLVLENIDGVYIDKLNSEIKLLEYKVSNNSFVLLRKIINGTKRLIWYLKHHNKYDFSCSYATYSIIGSKLSLISSKNNSLYIHSNYYELYKHNEADVINFMNSISIKEFKHVIFVSNESRDSIVSLIPEIKDNSITINNIIDYKDIIKKSNDKIDIKKEKNLTYYLFVGRIEEESKQLIRLVNSFDEAVKINNNIRLIIIGDGKDYNLIHNEINRLSLDLYVVMLGSKENPYPYIKMCDYLVLASNYEGYPVILLEGLVLNKQIISTVYPSDDLIDLKKYVNKIDKESSSITNSFINNKKINYNKIDFNIINNTNISKLVDIIEEK